MTTDPKREAFESFQRKRPDHDEVDLARSTRTPDRYASDEMQIAWFHWDAALATLPRFTDLAAELLQRKNAMKEALAEFAVGTGAKFDEVTLVEKDVSEGTKICYEYSIQKKQPIVWPEPPRFTEEELAMFLCEADGQDPHQLCWHTVEPGVQEPWGDMWNHYTPQARALIAKGAVLVKEKS